MYLREVYSHMAFIHAYHVKETIFLSEISLPVTVPVIYLKHDLILKIILNFSKNTKIIASYVL